SASMVSTTIDGLEDTYYLFKQLSWIVVGLIGFLFCSIFPYRHYQRFMVPIVIVSLLLLVAVIFFGHEEHNAQMLISIVGINIQSLAFVKFTLIIYLASVYSKKQKYINNFVRGVLPPLVVTVGMVGLIIMQPDIGTSSIILLVVAPIIISSGVLLKHILFLFSLSVG